MRINEKIKAPRVRLIDANGGQVGIVSRQEALRAAEETGLDLVEVSAAGAETPVCRVMDYGKFKFNQSKKKKKQKGVQIKEIKFRPVTEEGDYQTKLTKLVRFLESGNKVKVTLRYRGREMAHQELGMKLIDRLKVDLEPYGVIEQMPKFEGRQMIMTLAPRRT